MGQAERRVGGPVSDRRAEVGELAGLLLDEEVAVLVDEGDPGRVVAAVLESPQALDEDGPGLPGTGVSDDSAHAGRVSRRARGGSRGRASLDAPRRGRPRRRPARPRVPRPRPRPSPAARAPCRTAGRGRGPWRRAGPGRREWTAAARGRPPTGRGGGPGRRAAAAAAAESGRRARAGWRPERPSPGGPRAR